MALRRQLRFDESEILSCDCAAEPASASYIRAALVTSSFNQFLVMTEFSWTLIGNPRPEDKVFVTFFVIGKQCKMLLSILLRLWKVDDM